ncbi:MAG: hypothetical protein GY868_08120 [Deltaproteobacteria bacterium]|nr:hypothetical protein [Deltaproteobacteria bacterium]
MYKPHPKSIHIISIFIMLWLSCLPAAHAIDTEALDTLRGKGHGLFNFSGDGTVSVSGDGILIVNSDAVVTFNTDFPDTSDLLENEETDCIPADDDYCIYLGIDGRANVSGYELDISFAGANIGLTIDGVGLVSLKGYGIFRQGKVLGAWGVDGTEITLE